MKWALSAGACGFFALCAGCGDDAPVSEPVAADAADVGSADVTPGPEGGSGDAGLTPGDGGREDASHDAAAVDADASVPAEDAAEPVEPVLEYQAVELEPLPADTPL
ncbi:MAG: hypothetical protein ACOC1F_10490, partial [Myxococcota bacterium]